MNTALLATLISIAPQPVRVISSYGQFAQLDPAFCRTGSDPTTLAPLWTVTQEPSSHEERKYQVSWKLQTDSDSGYIAKTLESGSEFLVVRCLATGKWSIVGKGSVSGMNGTTALGTVSSNPSELKPGEISSAQIQAGNLYERPMVGDYLVPVEAHLVSTLRITPRISLEVAELFSRSSQSDFNSDLTDHGRQNLIEAFSSFKGMGGRVAVEAFINKPGNRSALRDASQLRATAVAQFLIRSFNLEDEQIVAMGMGSEEFQSGMQPVSSWPAKDIVEGITLRVIP